MGCTPVRALVEWMSKALDVRFKDQDEDYLHRVLELRVTSHMRLTTPARAVDAKSALRTSGVKLADARLFEAYFRVRADMLDQRMRDTSRQDAHTYELNALKRVADEAPIAVLQDYYELDYPTEKRTHYLIRTAHAYSDILVLPLLSRITGKFESDSAVEKYLAFVKRTLEIVDTYNRRPVMGTVPLKIPFTRIGDLIRLYCREGIRAFCLDFAAYTPEPARQAVETVLYELSDQKLLEESFLHAVNMSSGRPNRSKRVSSCHSILAYGYGVDSFGDLHTPRMKLDEQARVPRQVPVRVFSRRDYGEHLVEGTNDLRGIKPDLTGVRMQDCPGNKELVKVLNAEQHSLEAGSFPAMIREGNHKLDRHLAGKEYVDKSELRRIKQTRKAKQLTLDGRS